MSTILLVDDDDEVRNLIRPMLQNMGHAVVEAGNGKEALALQIKEPFDLVLTDLIMPVQEGMETIIEMRVRYPALKIIAMSGGRHISTKSYLEIARAVGADNILEKPFSMEEMAETITAALGRS